jgi:hypothetical protein
LRGGGGGAEEDRRRGKQRARKDIARPHDALPKFY